MSAELLPDIRRIVIGHKTDGTAAIIDDLITPVTVSPQFRVGQIFVQDQYVPDDPVQAIDGANAPSSGMVKEGGLVFKSVDIPPHTETISHFTDTVDHLIVTHGTFELQLHDGSKRPVHAGDVITQLAGIHQWNNIGDTWARFIGITSPSKPVVVNGSTLDKAPFNALKF